MRMLTAGDRSPDDRDATRTAPHAVSTGIQDRVLRVAARLFALHGFHAVSIRDIAHESNVSVSTVLYGGRTKQELLEQILARSFSADHGWTQIISSGRPEMVESFEQLVVGYERIVETLVQHAVDFPDNRRLWLRLLLDQPSLFQSFEARYTWPLFEHGFRLIGAGRERGILHFDDGELQHFVASVDWIMNGFFCGGILGFDGQRVDASSPTAVTELLDFLKQHGRRWFEHCRRDACPPDPV